MSKFNKIETGIKDLIVIEPTVFGDDRGFFMEAYSKKDFLEMVISNSPAGEIYNIGGFNEEQNINIVKLTLDTVARIKNEEPKYYLITYVQDRLGHDARYAIDPTKIVTELGWYPETDFITDIEKTIKWYLDNQEWVNMVS
ncbi:MAG: GDP-mannose 4,6-dehydratase [Cetobacterium sp.]